LGSSPFGARREYALLARCAYALGHAYADKKRFRQAAVIGAGIKAIDLS
jgi:hypothetical protein